MNPTARPHGVDTDPKLDLVLQREIDVPAELVWAAWTEPLGRRTRYTAIAMHSDEATRDRHEARGFHHGWATALDQLVAHMQQTGS